MLANFVSNLNKFLSAHKLKPINEVISTNENVIR